MKMTPNGVEGWFCNECGAFCPVPLGRRVPKCCPTCRDRDWLREREIEAEC